MRSGPLRRILLLSYGYTWNEAVQLKSLTISTLWAIAQDLVMRYGPPGRILQCAVCHSAGFWLSAMAIAPNQLPVLPMWRETTPIFFFSCQILSRNCEAKK
jgi:hypothetical protein